MPYFGRQGAFGVRNRFQYLASNGDTSVSGSDANGISMTFSDGLYIDVYLNGVKLKAGEDYNTTTANTVAGITAMSANDEVEVIVNDAFTVADTVSAADGGTFSGNVAMSGTLSVTGNATMSADASVGDDLTLGSDAAVINMGADSDVTITHNADKGITLNSKDISGVKSLNGTDSGSGANYGQIGGRRNMIYNGDMQICQRATSATTIGDGNTGYHVQDRWKFYEAGSPAAEVTWSKSSTAPDGFHSSLKLLATTNSGTVGADDHFTLSQLFEGQDLQGWNKGVAAARSVTLSFWVNATQTGTYCVNLIDADNSSRQISKSYTIDSADTWEYKTLTYEGDTTGAFDNDTALSLYVYWGLVAGTNYTSGTLATSWAAYDATHRFVGQVDAFDNTANNYHITGVQMELGDTATAFEYESTAENLIRCNRYYYKITNMTAYLYALTDSGGGTAYQRITFTHPPMRSNAPTASLSNTITNAASQGFQYAQEKTTTIYGNPSGGGTLTYLSSATITLDDEL